MVAVGLLYLFNQKKLLEEGRKATSTVADSGLSRGIVGAQVGTQYRFKQTNLNPNTDRLGHALHASDTIQRDIFASSPRPSIGDTSCGLDRPWYA